jgi:hypothetical protein
MASSVGKKKNENIFKGEHYMKSKRFWQYYKRFRCSGKQRQQQQQQQQKRIVFSVRRLSGGTGTRKTATG